MENKVKDLATKLLILITVHWYKLFKSKQFLIKKNEFNLEITYI